MAKKAAFRIVPVSKMPKKMTKTKLGTLSVNSKKKYIVFDGKIRVGEVFGTKTLATKFIKTHKRKKKYYRCYKKKKR